MPYFFSEGMMFKKCIFLLPIVLMLGCATLDENPSLGPVAIQPSTSGQIPNPIPNPKVKQKPNTPRSSEQVPAVDNSFVTIDHRDFQISYDPTIRSARYVKYLGLAENLRGARVRRRDKFIADPLLVEKGLAYVAPKEYVHSRYDRGHLAPSGDFTYSQTANDSTFVMSNMSPQKPKLNQQAWRQLEAKVRQWICGEQRVIIITGPIFGDHPETLKSGLAIPEQYFKIVIDDSPPRKVVAFIYNQTDAKVTPSERVAALSDIEAKTHLRFEDQLPAELQTTLRTPSALEEWKEGDCG